jgi:hypothetical protein
MKHQRRCEEGIKQEIYEYKNRMGCSIEQQTSMCRFYDVA